jgi:hypothetical protein
MHNMHVVSQLLMHELCALLKLQQLTPWQCLLEFSNACTYMHDGRLPEQWWSSELCLHLAAHQLWSPVFMQTYAAVYELLAGHTLHVPLNRVMRCIAPRRQTLVYNIVNRCFLHLRTPLQPSATFYKQVCYLGCIM